MRRRRCVKVALGTLVLLGLITTFTSDLDTAFYDLEDDIENAGEARGWSSVLKRRKSSQLNFLPMKLAPGQERITGRDLAQFKNVFHTIQQRRRFGKTQTSEVKNAGLTEIENEGGELMAVFQKWKKQAGAGNKEENTVTIKDDSPLRRDRYDHQNPYFSIIHIPRTAGGAILSVVRQFLGCSPTCSCRSPRECQVQCPYLFNQCGHSSDLLPNWFVQAHQSPVSLISMTMIRRPAERLNSVLAVMKRVKHFSKHASCCGLPKQAAAMVTAKMTLTNFASEDGVSNCMTRMLAGYEPADSAAVIDGPLLQKAKQRLSALTFFGLTERYNESLQLLWKTLQEKGLKIKAEKVQQFLSSLKLPNSSAKLPARTASDIENQAEQYDTQLYEFAKEIFEKRLCEHAIVCRKTHSNIKRPKR